MAGQLKPPLLCFGRVAVPFYHATPVEGLCGFCSFLHLWKSKGRESISKGGHAVLHSRETVLTSPISKKLSGQALDAFCSPKVVG